MENKYSKLYDATYKKVFSKLELEIKDFLTDQKTKHKTFNKTHNLLLDKLGVKNLSKYYIQSSLVFNDILNIYKNRYNEYEEAHVNLIYDELFKAFHLIDGIKRNFTFNDFIVELASMEATNEAYRLFRNSSRISELMYENNDFSKFNLREISGSIENDEVFREHLFVKMNRKNPGLYKNQEDFENREQELLKALNRNFLGVENVNSIKKRIERPPINKIKNFLLIKNYKKSFEDNAYKVLTEFGFINEDETEFDDMINVFFKNWNEHNSRFYFDCSTEQAGMLIFLLKKYFKNLTFASINRSELFYSFDMNILKEDNLSKSKNNASKQDKKEIKSIIKQIFSFRSE